MTDQTRFCAACGTKLRPGGQFCGACGSPVVDRPAPETAPQPPAPQIPASSPLLPAPAPETPWPSALPEMGSQAAPPPAPSFGPEPAWPVAAPVYTPAYAPPPPVNKGGSKVPCVVGGCLGALVLLALGCWALSMALGSLLPAVLPPGLSFGPTRTPVVLDTPQPAPASPPAATATATRPPMTPTPAPPTPTLTPVKPTSTPTPVQVYTADFSGAARDWVQTTEAFRRQYVQNATYHTVFTSTAPATAWLVPLSNPVFKDFTLEFKARYESGPERDGYGAVLRMTDNDNFYFFLVTADGKWGFAKRVKGAWSSLVPLTANSAILKGKSPNTMRIVAKGAVFTFSINGTQVGAFTDSSHTAGTVGVFTSNETAGTFHVVYESFKATILSP